MTFISEDFKTEQKENFKSRTELFEDIAFELQRKAEKCMSHSDYSITSHQKNASNINLHDYYSEAPYWWPNPPKPKRTLY